MKKMNKIIVAVLSVTMLFGATLTANAASTEVLIEVKETAMDDVSVTVPTTIPIVFNENGTNTLPSNWTIENKSSIAGIHLSKVEMNAGESGWKLLGPAEDTTILSADTKAMQFFMGREGDLRLVEPLDGTEGPEGVLEFNNMEISIMAGLTETILFEVSRGAFTESQASAKAFDMILTFNFD